MKNILCFAGSTSKNSINKQLVEYAARLTENTSVTVLDLNDFEMPIYSTDREKESGIPNEAQQFFDAITNADALVVSLAEHNGAYTTAFKNVFDWTSRVNPKIFQNKPMALLATSPGPRGGLGVLEIAKDRFPRHNAEIIGTFSLPSFNDNFKPKTGIINTELRENLKTLMAKL